MSVIIGTSKSEQAKMNCPFFDLGEQCPHTACPHRHYHVQHNAQDEAIFKQVCPYYRDQRACPFNEEGRRECPFDHGQRFPRKRRVTCHICGEQKAWWQCYKPEHRFSCDCPPPRRQKCADCRHYLGDIGSHLRKAISVPGEGPATLGPLWFFSEAEKDLEQNYLDRVTIRIKYRIRSHEHKLDEGQRHPDYCDDVYHNPYLDSESEQTIDLPAIPLFKTWVDQADEEIQTLLEYPPFKTFYQRKLSWGRSCGHHRRVCESDAWTYFEILEVELLYSA